MSNITTIWFYDYDAKPCLLYRSALSLREEAWEYTKKPEQAKWWVVYAPDENTEEKIKALYKQQKERPVVVLLKNDQQSEYHKSWSVLKMPLNYVTFFKWLDEVVGKLKNGTLNTRREGWLNDSEEAFDAQRWNNEPFRLKSWPNVARYGEDINIVIYCASMLSGFTSRNKLLTMGMDPQQFISVLSIAEKHHMIVYKDQTPSKSATYSGDSQKNTVLSNQTETQASTTKLKETEGFELENYNPEQFSKEKLPMLVSDEEKPDEKNNGLFNAILKMFGVKK